MLMESLLECGQRRYHCAITLIPDNLRSQQRSTISITQWSFVPVSAHHYTQPPHTFYTRLSCLPRHSQLTPNTKLGQTLISYQEPRCILLSIVVQCSRWIVDSVRYSCAMCNVCRHNIPGECCWSTSPSFLCLSLTISKLHCLLLKQLIVSAC